MHRGRALTTPVLILGVTAFYVMAVLLEARLVRRLANGCHAFDRAPDIFRFTVFAGLLSPMLSATLGVVSLTVGGFAHWVDSGALWWTWWLGDAMGVILLTPPILSW